MNLLNIDIQDGLGFVQVVFPNIIVTDRFRKYQRDFIDLIAERDSQDDRIDALEDRIKVLTAELNAAYAVANS